MINSIASHMVQQSVKKLNKNNNNIKKMTQEKTREIVIPGEVVGKGDLLPGDWTTKQGDEIIATRLGVIDITDRLVKVVPISGVYTPRRGNIVIGSIQDLTMRGWIVDIGAPYDSFLQLKECPMYVNESEMQDVYGIGDLVIAKIFKTGRTSIDLTTKGRGLGRIKEGFIMKVNPHRVPRVIGKEGSMVSQIKIATNTEVTIGQNGVIWIKGKNPEDEMLARDAIEFVVDNITSEGLTAMVEEWLKKNKKAGSSTNEEAPAEAKEAPAEAKEAPAEVKEETKEDAE